MMDENLKQFKTLFILESIFGTSTVSLTTLNQSKWKVAYAVFLITVYVVEVISFDYHVLTSQVDIDNVVLYVSRHISYYMVLRWLAGGIQDYKSKISSALNLEAIEKQLESLGIPVSGKNWFKAMKLFLTTMTVLLITTGCMSCALDVESDLPLTRYVTTAHFLGSHLLQEFPLIMFLTKVVVIQQALTKGFSKIIQNQRTYWSSRSQRPRNRGRRSLRIPTEEDKAWLLLTELQGCLHTTEYTIRDCYWMQILWCRLVIEISYPMVCILWIKKSGDEEEVIIKMVMGLFLIIMVLIFLGIVYAVERTNKEKKKAYLALGKEITEEGTICKDRVKHQVLAKIHRSRAPFSCAIFDVDYALLIAILENVVFVITTMIGSSTKV